MIEIVNYFMNRIGSFMSDKTSKASGGIQYPKWFVYMTIFGMPPRNIRNNQPMQYFEALNVASVSYFF